MKLSIRIQPNASKNEILRMSDGTIKIKLQAPAVDNRANEALIEFLSKKFNVSKKAITILRGLHSRSKVIEIEGVEAEDVLKIFYSQN